MEIERTALIQLYTEQYIEQSNEAIINVMT